jgi:hypothetical protein
MNTTQRRRADLALIRRIEEAQQRARRQPTVAVRVYVAGVLAAEETVQGRLVEMPGKEGR